jgi:hypothetical protein
MAAPPLNSAQRNRAHFEAELRSCLPRPNPDTPEERARLEAAACAAFDALNPGSAIEASHAVQWVVLHAAALDAQARARTDPFARAHERQARALLGFADTSLKFLLRSQTERMKRDAAPAPGARTGAARQKPRRQSPKPD